MWDETKHIAELEKIYKDAMLNVMNTLLKKESKGQSTLFYKNQLKELTGILSKLDQDYMEWINDNVPAAYNSSKFNAQSYISKVLKYDKYPHKEFSQVHQRSIDVLTQNLTDNLRSANQFVGRQIQDAFRTEQLRQTVNKVAAGKTVNQMAKEMAESLRSQGIVCFKDRLGRNWSLETYSKMCARTVTRQAATTATINTCDEASVDLVQISTHIGACPLCQEIQGKIYSLSGKSTVYAKYGENDVVIPRHPNCAHVLVPFIAELNKNTGGNLVHEQLKINSNGTNNRFVVDKQLVNSKTYHDKFEDIPLSKNARESLYIKAKEILKHRDGTEDEDLVVLDLRTGKEIIANRESKDGYKTGLTYAQYMQVQKHDNDVILLHNHPEGGRLSGTDIITMYKESKVFISVVAGHDGTIHYIYDMNRKIDIEKIYKEEYNEFKKYYEDNMAKKKATDVLYSLNVFKYVKR